jgi:hypothetical protein
MPPRNFTGCGNIHPGFASVLEANRFGAGCASRKKPAEDKAFLLGRGFTQACQQLLFG